MLQPLEMAGYLKLLQIFPRCQTNEELEFSRKRRRYSNIGFLLLFIGFLLQLIGTLT